MSMPIPRSRSAATRAAVLAALIAGSTLVAPVVAGAETHVVEPGETLSHVAVETGVSVAELQALNGITDVHRVYAGQRLEIGTRRAVETPSSTYTVLPGDTLGAIAVRFGTTTRILMDQNAIADANRIRPGTVLTVPGAVIEPSDRPNLPERLRSRPERLALVPVFEKWAAANEIDPALLMALAFHESGWNQDAVSHAGAVGIGQLMPVSAQWIAAFLIGRPELDRTLPEDNIRMSARYLSWLLQRFDDERLAIGAYFQGPTSVSAGIWNDSTELYVQNVLAQRPNFG